jgi:hypothetical protein
MSPVSLSGPIQGDLGPQTVQPLNVPVDAFNHAMDAARCAISDLVGGKHYTFRVRTALAVLFGAGRPNRSNASRAA